MSNERIKQLIDSLTAELKASELDTKTISQLRKFELAIEPYLAEDECLVHDNTLLDKANKLEIEFAQKHPVAEGIMRELVESLNRMGI